MEGIKIFLSSHSISHCLGLLSGALVKKRAQKKYLGKARTWGRGWEGRRGKRWEGGNTSTRVNVSSSLDHFQLFATIISRLYGKLVYLGLGVFRVITAGQNKEKKILKIISFCATLVIILLKKY